LACDQARVRACWLAMSGASSEAMTGMNQKPHTATGGALSERLVPLGAGLSAVTPLLSCWPLTVATARGAVTLSVALTPFRWWLVGLSTVFLAIGFTLLFRQPRARRS